MYEVIKFVNGQTIVIIGLRDAQAAMAKATELSRLENAVFAVRRKDMNRIIMYCVRGERTTSAPRILELLTDPDLPAVLGLVEPEHIDEEPLIKPDDALFYEADATQPWQIVEDHWSDDMTTQELRDMAKEARIRRYTVMDRQELINALERDNQKPGPQETK